MLAMTPVSLVLRLEGHGQACHFCFWHVASVEEIVAAAGLLGSPQLNNLYIGFNA